MPSFTENIKVDGQDMQVYSSIPTGSGPFPAVVVIHHAAGVDPFTRDIADRLAGEGYVAAAPDLFHRVAHDLPADIMERIARLSDPEIIADVNATVDFLRSNSAIDGDRLGIVGFCMGGRVVYLAAATNSHFKAAVPYYGGNIMVTWGKATQTPFDLTSQINCPILFHFGETDPNPSPADRDKLDAELTRLGKAHQFFSYPDAGHAFMNYTGQMYHKGAAEASWPRTLEFFANHLKAVTVR